MKNLNQNINQNTKLGKSVIKFTIGSRDVPLPIHLELVPITKALDKIWWGNLTEWKRDKIDQKQRNLAKALKDYPRNVHAKINKGMFLILVLLGMQLFCTDQPAHPTIILLYMSKYHHC